MSTLIKFRWTWVRVPSAPYICIRGRVVEGTGLIIRFPMERHWFEPSRMQFAKFLQLFFYEYTCTIEINKLLNFRVKFYVKFKYTKNH